MKLAGTEAAKEAFQRTFGSIIKELGIELTNQCAACAAKGGCKSPRIEVQQVAEDPTAVSRDNVLTVKLVQPERLSEHERGAIEQQLRSFLKPYLPAPASRH